MALRRAFFLWLIPAAFVLPLWLLIGWIAFGASPWGLLWVFVSAPIVFVWQLVVTLLIRARGTVRAERSVSWTDIGVAGAWHLAIVTLGVFDERWWWPVLALTVLLGLALMWTSLSQLWREARPTVIVGRTGEGIAYTRPAPAQPPRAGHEVIVVEESPHDR